MVVVVVPALPLFAVGGVAHLPHQLNHHALHVTCPRLASIARLCAKSEPVHVAKHVQTSPVSNLALTTCVHAEWWQQEQDTSLAL